MLQETEIEEIIGHVSKFLSLVASQLGVGALGLPGYTYGFMTTKKFAVAPIIKFGITKLLRNIYCRLLEIPSS